MLRLCIDEIFRAPDYDDTVRVLMAKSTELCPDHPESHAEDQLEWWGDEEEQMVDLNNFSVVMGIPKDQLHEGMVFLMPSLTEPGIQYTQPCKEAVKNLYERALTGR